MIVPNKYEISKKITREKLLRNGFEQYYSHFYIRKWLYKDVVCLDLEIDFEDVEPHMFLTVKRHDSKQYYVPFYCNETRLNNKIYTQVVARYNKYMDMLCTKGILWRKGYKGIVTHKRRKRIA